MSAAAIISRARSDGVQLSVTDRGTIEVRGPVEAVARWRPAIVENKPEIVAALSMPESPTESALPADEKCPGFDPAALQAEADRRNAQARQDGITDRWCSCGRLATLAWPIGGLREAWRCDDCAPTRGRA